MDLLAILTSLLLNASLGCSAMKAEQVQQGSQTFLVQAWACENRNHELQLWRAWQRACVSSEHVAYPGRVVFIEETGSNLAIYYNAFGELQGGIGAGINAAYLPLCGS